MSYKSVLEPDISISNKDLINSKVATKSIIEHKWKY